jgi:hypothetical protein
MYHKIGKVAGKSIKTNMNNLTQIVTDAEALFADATTAVTQAQKVATDLEKLIADLKALATPAVVPPATS